MELSLRAIANYRWECDVALFPEYFARVARELGLADEDKLADGVYELAGEPGTVSVALDRARHFLALAWNELTEGIPVRSEAFFVVPRGRPAQVGARVTGLVARELEHRLAATYRERGALRLKFAGPPQAAPIPSFLELVSLLSSGGAAAGDKHAEQRLALESEVVYLRQLLREQSDELRQAKAAVRDAREAVGADDGLAARHAETTAPEVTDLADLAQLSDWCALHEDDIVVLPRARAGAKKSLYESPATIFRALEILAGPYRQFRRGELSKAEFDEQLLPTGLRLSGSVGFSVAGAQGDAYFVSWAGRRRFLDSHLLKGGGRDERYCLRVYFFWDDESQRAVVGSLPFHLANSLS